MIAFALSKFPHALKPAMVGDRPEDMEAAKGAGIAGIFLRNPYHGVESLHSLLPYKPRIISTLSELPKTYHELKVE